jgi:hypothetical protein
LVIKWGVSLFIPIYSPVDKKVDAVDKKVDAVYDELVAHRNDTELHRRPTKRSPLKKVA